MAKVTTVQNTPQRQVVRAVVIRDNKLLVMQRNKFGNIYYTLIGGGIDSGEDHLTALAREIDEETGLGLRPETARLVFVHEIEPYGVQHIYLCDVRGEEPRLKADSEEAAIHAEGQNLYTPMWLAVDKLGEVPFRSSQLAIALQAGIESGFPEQPKRI